MDPRYGVAQEASVLAAEARETPRGNWDQLSARLNASYDRYAASHETPATDVPPPGTRVHITHCASRPELVGDEGETVGPLSDGIAVRVRVHGLGMFAEHRVVAVQGWEVLG